MLSSITKLINFFLGCIYVYGGLNKVNSTGWTGDCFYTESNKWTTRSGMRRPRKEFMMVHSKRKIVNLDMFVLAQNVNCDGFQNCHLLLPVYPLKTVASC